LVEDQPWSVDLSPLIYRVWVDAHFEADDGLIGQTSVVFGLVVTSSAIDATTVRAACGAMTSSPDAG
jgi:hypothetical protein